jgi:hypothetical protein
MGAAVTARRDACARRSDKLRRRQPDTVALGRSVAFYRDVIGMTARIDGDGYVEFAMDTTKFASFERSGLPELIGRRGGTPPCGEIGFLTDDVDGEAQRLTALGRYPALLVRWASQFAARSAAGRRGSGSPARRVAITCGSTRPAVMRASTKFSSFSRSAHSFATHMSSLSKHHPMN